MQEVLINSI